VLWTPDAKVDHRAPKSDGVAQGTVDSDPEKDGSVYGSCAAVDVDVPAAGGVEVIAPPEGRLAAATFAASIAAEVAPVVGVAGITISTIAPEATPSPS
jgi:hypothetical protein